MRLSKMSIVLVFAGSFLALAGTAALVAQESNKDQDEEQEDDDPAARAERERVAAEALAKAVARGKQLWSDKSLFKKTCSSCHDDPEKPNNHIVNRTFSYPAYSRRARGVVTMHQKIQEMVVKNSKGQRLDDKGGDVAALEAYVMSLKKK